MAFTEVLRLLVDMDTKAAVTGAEKLGNTAEREAARSQKSLDKWGSKLTSVGTGMVTFGAAALFGLGKAAMASEEAGLSVVKLENTISNMPKLAGENSKQFIELADSIQGVTAADADAIVEGQALLGTFSLTAKEIKGITPLVVDYARKFGTDIPTAAIQVGKALDGSIGALKKNGVSIDEVLYKTDRYAAVQKALSDQVGGFAEDEGKTFAGSLQRLKNEMGDLAEGVGAGAVDAFSSMFGAVSGVSDRLNELSPEVQSTVGKVATYGSVALVAAGATSTLIGQAIKARENFAALGQGLAGVSSKLGGLANVAANMAVFAAGVMAAELALDKLFPVKETNLSKLENELVRFRESGKLAGEAVDLLGKDFEKLRDATAEVFDSSFANDAGNAIDLITTVGGQFNDLDTDKARRLFNDLDEALTSLAAQDPDAAAELFSRISEEMKKAGATTEDIQGKLDGYTATLTKADTASRLTTDAVGEGTDAMRDNADATEDAKTALQEWADAQRAMFDPLFAFNDALLSNAEAQGKVTQSELQLAAAQTEVNKAIKAHGPNSEEATAATMKLMEAQGDLEQAHRDVIESAVDYDSAFADLKAGVEDGSVSITDAKATVDRWASSGRSGAASAAFYKGEIDKLAGGLRSVPNARSTTVSVKNAVQAREELYGVRDAANSIPPSRTVTVYVRSEAELLAGYRLPGRAGGGDVGPGWVGWVGEDGPELLAMGKGGGGHVYTKGQLAGMSGGGGMAGGVTQIFNIDARGALLPRTDDLERVVAQAVDGAKRKGYITR